MINKKKKELISYLQKSGYLYEENALLGKAGVIADVFVPKYNIIFKVGDSEVFYNRTKKRYWPIFIRDNEDIDFIIEKFNNTVKAVKAEQNQKRYV